MVDLLHFALVLAPYGSSSFSLLFSLLLFIFYRRCLTRAIDCVYSGSVVRVLLMDLGYLTDPLLCFVFCHLFLYVLVLVFGVPCFNYGEGDADDDWGN